jgi:hypothetical protein
MDRELAGAEMLQIRSHLSTCPACSAEHDALARVKSLLAGTPPAGPSGDATAAVMRHWSERRYQSAAAPRRRKPPTPPRWMWLLAAPRWQRFSMAFTAVCLVLALAATAMALRKPNEPDALWANIGPRLAQPDETFHLQPPPADRPWIPSAQSELWRNVSPSVPAQPLLISDGGASSFGWGR